MVEQKSLLLFAGLFQTQAGLPIDANFADFSGFHGRLRVRACFYDLSRAQRCGLLSVNRQAPSRYRIR
jgi:hypothetical protein